MYFPEGWENTPFISYIVQKKHIIDGPACTVKEVEYSEQENAVILKLVDHADVIMSEDLARKIANMLIAICESKKEINHIIS